MCVEGKSLGVQVFAAVKYLMKIGNEIGLSGCLYVYGNRNRKKMMSLGLQISRELLLLLQKIHLSPVAAALRFLKIDTHKV